MFQDDGSSSVTSTPNQIFPAMAASCQLRTTPYPWLKEFKSEERGLCLIHLLLTCATHVTSGNFDHANLALDQISHLASPEGDTMQRIASYFAEALANRILKSWPGLYKALHSTKISTGNDDILFRKSFFDCFPFLKIAFVIANQTIIEAMEGEKMVHVVDLNAVEPTQWRALLHEFAGRPGGPPHLRITGIHHQKKVLDHMASTLTEEAEKLDIPFQFNPIVTKLDDLDIDKLKIKTGEALAISSILQFHLMLTNFDKTARKSPPISKTEDSFTSCTVSSTKLDRFLNRLWGLSPKIMVVAEQESDHNQSDLMERLSESLYFYAALFDCSESTLPRTSPERLKIEKMLGEEIKNIIACDGEERIKRHEKLDKWIQRLSLMGFGPVTLSYYGLLLAQRLIHGSSCNGCRIKEKNGCVVICWQDRPIFSVSAWNSRR
ncbi:hypothetical protein Lser_V15G29918 [Lactuca serriola]